MAATRCPSMHSTSTRIQHALPQCRRSFTKQPHPRSSPALHLLRPALHLASTTQLPSQRPTKTCAYADAAGFDDFQQASTSDEAITNTGNSSFAQAVFNVLNVVMGVGLLSLPFALRQSGWAGLGILWVMGIVTNYTGKALVECHGVVSKKVEYQHSKVGYEEVAEAAFGWLGKLIVSSMIYVELFGTCCLLFILEGDNMFSLFGMTAQAASPTAYMALAAMVMIPTLWLPDLRSLSFLGMCGIAATFCVGVTVAYTLLSGSFVAGAATTMIQPHSLPLVFGIMAFVFSGHGVFPSIQASMKEPQRFPAVLNVAFLIIGTMCTFMAAAGYYMYGTGALDVISFNLPPGILSTLCASVILINPIAKFALTLEPVAAAATSLSSPSSGARSPAPVRMLIRTVVGLSCLAAARYCPFLAPLMSLIGAFLTIGVSVIVPALCHLSLHPDAPPSRKFVNGLVVAIGVVCMVSGTASSLISLAAKTGMA